MIDPENVELQNKINAIHNTRIDSYRFLFARPRTFWQKVGDWLYCKMNPVRYMRRG